MKRMYFFLFLMYNKNQIVLLCYYYQMVFVNLLKGYFQLVKGIILFEIVLWMVILSFLNLIIELVDVFVVVLNGEV